METDELVRAEATIELAGNSKLDYGEVEFVVSSAIVDRHGETIDVKGIDFKNYQSNPVILWAHDYEGLPLGKATKVWRRGDQLMARAKFATEILPFADIVYKLIREEVINAVSIGGRVKKWGTKDGQKDYQHIAELEMFEFSVVNVPANPAALVTSKSIDGLTQSDVAKSYDDFVSRAQMPGIAETLNNHVTILKDLQSGLENIIRDASSLTAGEPKSTLSKTRKIARVMKVQTDEFIRDLNSELKGLHNG